MSIFYNLLRSFLLTTLMSFITPILFVGGILGTTYGISYVPGFDLLGKMGATQIFQFLKIFGSGYPIQGILTIGITCSIVGGLLDLFNFYRYQSYQSFRD